MDFNFYEQYKGYSNTDLLKIVKRPGDYQANAVSVATQLLNERQITSEEIQFVDEYYQGIDKIVKARKDKVETYKSKATDFLEPIIHPSEKIQPVKWLNILLLVIALQYVWSLFGTTRRLINFFRCSYCRFDIDIFAELLTLLYVPLIFFLLYRRKRWGWIFLFADNLFTLISTLSQSYIFFKYQSIHHGSTVSFLWPIFVKAAFVFFLWRNSIANQFGVTQETKIKTAFIITIATLIFISLLYLMYGL